MANNKELDALLQILSGETIIQRTDQKAFTFLSILGAFMVLLIAILPKCNLIWSFFLFNYDLFLPLRVQFIFLVRVLIPRFEVLEELNDNPDEEQIEDINPTFFAGMSPEVLPASMQNTKSIANDEKAFKMFSAQVFSLGLINRRKTIACANSWCFFVTALTSEL